MSASAASETGGQQNTQLLPGDTVTVNRVIRCVGACVHTVHFKWAGNEVSHIIQ